MEKLTNLQFEVMEVLWQAEKGLSSHEIIERSKDAGWQKSYIHLMLNSLLEKGMIEVDGFVKRTKNYARTFKPKMSKSEYVLQQAENKCGYEELVKAIAAKVNSIDELYRLIDILADRKKEIG